MDGERFPSCLIRQLSGEMGAAGWSSLRQGRKWNPDLRILRSHWAEDVPEPQAQGHTVHVVHHDTAGTLAPAQRCAAHIHTDTNGVWCEIAAAVFWSVVLKELLDIYDINSGLAAFCPGKSLILIARRSLCSYLENRSVCGAFRGFVLLLSVTAATS